MLLQVDAQGKNPKARAPRLRYHPLAGYSIPAWALDIKPWERDKKPVLEAFWSEDPPPVAGVLRRGQHFGDDLQVMPASTLEVQLGKVERGSVRLTSINIEKHTVGTHDGGVQKVSCLVLHMTFPPGKPVMAQPPSEFSVGQEHRFYSEAGKYTGIFWEMTPRQAQHLVQSINLLSLVRFREAALASGQYALIELRLPNNNPRPKPLP
jgi:hypothetical protein